MNSIPSSTLDDNLIGSVAVDRRALLPKWIKVFCWIFLIMGGLLPALFLARAFGVRSQLELYGLSTDDAFTPLGIFLAALLLIKFVTAFGLWTRKEWAVDLGLVDAILGILICCTVMFVFPFFPEIWGNTLRIRLELIALIPYLMTLRRIRPAWKKETVSPSQEKEWVV